MSYIDIFGGSAVVPTNVEFELLTLTAATTTLSWPDLATDGTPVAARIVEITTALSGAVVKLPDARDVSVGQDILMKNIGANTVSVQVNTGGSLLTLASGEIKYVYLTSNATQGGTWSIVAFGASVGSLDASALAGLGLLAIGSTLNSSLPVIATSLSLTAQLSDRARIYTFTGGAATVTLQSSATYGTGFFFGVSNTGSGAVTIQPSGIETIDGAASIAINPGESAFIATNGSNWFTVGRGRSVNFNFTQLVKDVSGNSDVTLTTTEAANKVLKFIGTLTGNINVIVPNVVSQYTVDNQTSGSFTLTVKTAAGAGVIVPQANRNILYSDGTNVLAAVTVSVAITSFADGSAAAPPITFTSNTSLGLYRAANNVLGITADGVTQMLISPTDIVSDSLDKKSIAFAIALN